MGTPKGGARDTSAVLTAAWRVRKKDTVVKGSGAAGSIYNTPFWRAEEGPVEPRAAMGRKVKGNENRVPTAWQAPRTVFHIPSLLSLERQPCEVGPPAPGSEG